MPKLNFNVNIYWSENNKSKKNLDQTVFPIWTICGFRALEPH